MENRHRQKGWREEETLEAAARRLLQEWDERIARKKAAERLEASAQIADQPAASLADAEVADGASDGVTGSLKRRPQHTAREGHDSAIENEGGRAADSPVETGVLRANGCARPNPEDAIGADRAEVTLRRFR